VYGKLFTSMYDGTLRADWKALVTFQQMIVLSDAHGVVDLTAHAIHGRTGIPLDIIEPGIEKLSAPDPYSRSDEQEGRRIVLLDPSRPWGWRIVNHNYYRNLASVNDKREKDRTRLVAKRRKLSQAVADGRVSSERVANVAHTEAEAEAEAEAKKQNNTMSANADPVGVVFAYWQEKLKHPRAILTPERRAKIKRSLTHYLPADLCKAIDGCAATPHNMGDNDRGEKYDDIELIVRDAKHVERFMRNADDPPKPRISSRPSELQRAATAIRDSR